MNTQNHLKDPDQNQDAQRKVQSQRDGAQERTDGEDSVANTQDGGLDSDPNEDTLQTDANGAGEHRQNVDSSIDGAVRQAHGSDGDGEYEPDPSQHNTAS